MRLSFTILICVWLWWKYLHLISGCVLLKGMLKSIVICLIVGEREQWKHSEVKEMARYETNTYHTLQHLPQLPFSVLMLSMGVIRVDRALTMWRIDAGYGSNPSLRKVCQQDNHVHVKVLMECLFSF